MINIMLLDQVIISVEHLYALLGVVSTITGGLSIVIFRIYRHGKKAGTDEAVMSTVTEKLDALKVDFETEKTQAQQEHAEIRANLKDISEKHDRQIGKLSKQTNRMEGMLSVLVKKLIG